MRLFLVYYLSVGASSISKSDMDEFRDSLEKSGCDMRALKYIEKWVSYSILILRISSKTRHF